MSLRQFFLFAILTFGLGLPAYCAELYRGQLSAQMLNQLVDILPKDLGAGVDKTVTDEAGRIPIQGIFRALIVAPRSWDRVRVANAALEDFYRVEQNNTESDLTALSDLIAHTAFYSQDEFRAKLLAFIKGERNIRAYRERLNVLNLQPDRSRIRIVQSLLRLANRLLETRRDEMLARRIQWVDQVSRAILEDATFVERLRKEDQSLMLDVLRHYERMSYSARARQIELPLANICQIELATPVTGTLDPDRPARPVWQ